MGKVLAAKTNKISKNCSVLSIVSRQEVCYGVFQWKVKQDPALVDHKNGGTCAHVEADQDDKYVASVWKAQKTFDFINQTIILFLSCILKELGAHLLENGSKK